jgi:ABC-type phosphate/phosphonate transport system substrate-binding protein
VPSVTAERVRRALLSMATDPAAAAVLAQAQFKGFEPATDSDYEGVRRIYRLIGQ